MPIFHENIFPFKQDSSVQIDPCDVFTNIISDINHLDNNLLNGNNPD